MAILLTSLEDIKGPLPITPLNHGDFSLASPPLLHGSQGWMINIDGVRSYESRTIVIDDIGVRQSFNLKFCSDGILGPVSSGTAHFPIFEVGSQSVLFPGRSGLVLHVRVGGRSHHTTAFLVAITWRPILVLGKFAALLNRNFADRSGMESVRALIRTALRSDSGEYRAIETMNPVNFGGNVLTTAGENKGGKKGEHW